MFSCRIRAKHFPRGWSFVQGAHGLPILLGASITGYLNGYAENRKAGYYLSFVFVILGAVTLFFMDYWKNRHRHKHDKYCEVQREQVAAPENMIEPENMSEKLSEVHNNSVAGMNSVILSEQESIKDAETLNKNLNNNNRVTFTMVVPLDDHDDDDDDEHSYHFRGKPELLAGISEENLLEQLEIEYLGDITSCNKVSLTSIICG